MLYTHEQLLSQAKFSSEDMVQIMQYRGEHNRLGFAYQLAFVRSLNRFPAQEPLEIIDDILTNAFVQLNTVEQHINQYGKRQPTIAIHQESIRHYLGLRQFNTATVEIEAFLFKEACQLEQRFEQLKKLPKKQQITVIAMLDGLLKQNSSL